MKLPERKKGQDKLDWLANCITNHIWTRMNWQDVKLNFIMVLLAVVIALIALALRNG